MHRYATKFVREVRSLVISSEIGHQNKSRDGRISETWFRSHECQGMYWSGRWDSNPRHSAWKADALPLSYSRSQIAEYSTKLTSPSPFLNSHYRDKLILSGTGWQQLTKLGWQLMTTAPEIEHQVEAYLVDEDSPDIENPIHSTEVAKQFGFSGPLVGGVTVWGWATPTIIEAVGEDWLNHGWAEFAFRQPTYPGDILTIRAELTKDAGIWAITMSNQENVDCVRGTVGLGAADWLHELSIPKVMTAAAAPDPKMPLVLDTAPVGKDFLPLPIDATADFARTFALEDQHSDDPRFIGENPLLHPSWTAGWAEAVLRHNFHIAMSMHTRSRIQHLAKIPAGQIVTGGAHFLEAYERHPHHFANFDVLVRGEDEKNLAQMVMSERSVLTIIKI